MADFNAYLPKLLGFEGGFVDDPDDPGGATNKGITMKTFQTSATPLLGLPPTLENLRALTDAQAGRLYKPLYWDAAHADELASQALAEMLVDWSVNSGQANVVRTLQALLNTLSAQPLLPVSGTLCEATLRQLKNAEAVWLCRGLRQARIDHYQQLAKRRPALQRFLKGWLSRVEALAAE